MISIAPHPDNYLEPHTQSQDCHHVYPPNFWLGAWLSNVLYKWRQTMKKKINRHHILCRSRGGKDDDNIVLLPVSFHACWHQLFGNMTIAEIHVFIDTIMKPNMVWQKEDLHQLQNFLSGQEDKNEDG
jgi:hypothetical protein